MLDNVLPSTSNVWIFQCNPKLYKIKEALSDSEVIRCFHWKVKQHKDKIAKGHFGIIWCSGLSGGIYAITELISDPGFFVESDSEKKYWIDLTGEQGSQYRVKMKIIRNLAETPLIKDVIRNTGGLQNLSILRMPRGTNFFVTAEEWKLIEKLIK